MIVASAVRIIVASKLATPDLQVAPGSNYPPPSTHSDFREALASAPTHAVTPSGDRTTGSGYASGNLGVRISSSDDSAAPATSVEPPAIPSGMPDTLANGGKSPWVPMYSPVGQTLGGSAVSSSREGRSKLGATLVAAGGVAVLGIAAVVWFMTRPVPPEGEPQVASPTQEALSGSQPPDLAETAAKEKPNVEPEVTPSASVEPPPVPSAEPSAKPEPRPKSQPKSQAKPTAKPASTPTNDADSMLKYRK